MKILGYVTAIDKKVVFAKAKVAMLFPVLYDFKKNTRVFQF